MGCHGLHVTAGLLWLGTMMAQFYAKGFRRDIQHRFLCFSLFWHALDIIWVAIFSLVYLVGDRSYEQRPNDDIARRRATSRPAMSRKPAERSAPGRSRLS